MRLNEVRKILLQDPEFNKEYNKYDLAFEISQMVIEARIMKEMTQEKLAELVGTKQPSLARLENGNYLPSLRFLEKIANALGTRLISPRFAFMEKEKVNQSGNFGVIVTQQFNPKDINVGGTIQNMRQNIAASNVLLDKIFC